MLWSHGISIVADTSTSVQEIRLLFVRVEEEVKVVLNERWIVGSGGG